MINPTFPPRCRVRPFVCAVLLSAATCGCAVGPDFTRPVAALPQAYTAVPLPQATAATPGPLGAAQRLVVQQDIQRDWWALFHSPALDALIEQAFAANPGIETAQAALRIAQENVDAQQGLFFPTVQASYTPARTKLAGNLGGNSPGIQGNGSVISTGQGTPASAGGTAPFNSPVIYNFHTAQLTIGFVPDLFGANRRQVESLEAQRRAQQFQLEATYITLASNIVAAAFQDAMLRSQIALTGEMIAAARASMVLSGRQVKAGYASRLDLAAQESALAQLKASLPPLQKQFEQNRDLLRALSGTAADAPVPQFELGQFALPQELPLSLPSRLIEQRPDVRAAEEQLHAASAAVGVARAARLPQFSINASAGGAASQFGQMFAPGGKFFDLSAGVGQTLFDAGTLKHREAAAVAALRGADAQYRATVIAALQNVADVLHAVERDAEALQAADEAAGAARNARALTQRQHAAGYLDRLVLIAAEQNERQAQLALIQARAVRLGDSAGLFQALGGGWWHRNAQDGGAETRAPAD